MVSKEKKVQEIDKIWFIRHNKYYFIHNFYCNFFFYSFFPGQWFFPPIYTSMVKRENFEPQRETKGKIEMKIQFFM